MNSPSRRCLSLVVFGLNLIPMKIEGNMVRFQTGVTSNLLD